MTIPHRIIATDPGKHMGYAIFVDGLQKEIGVVHGEEEIWPWLIQQKCDLMIIEDYKLRDEKHGGFDHQFQSLFPSQVIGALKFYCSIRGIPYVLQQPQIKYAACPLLFGKPYEKKSNKHHIDAVLHGLYWIKKNGNI